MWLSSAHHSTLVNSGDPDLPEPRLPQPWRSNGSWVGERLNGTAIGFPSQRLRIMTTSDFTLAWTLALYLTCLLLAISPQPKGGSRPERARGSADGNGGLWAPQAAVPRPAKASGSLVPQPCAPADGRGNKSGFEPETYRLSRLSCRTFAANAVRLQLHVLAYNLGNFMRTLAMPKTAQPWSLTSL